MSKLDRYIKNNKGEKVPQRTTSINILKSHLDFLRRKNLNLSLLVRDFLDRLLKEDEEDIL